MTDACMHVGSRALFSMLGPPFHKVAIVFLEPCGKVLEKVAQDMGWCPPSSTVPPWRMNEQDWLRRLIISLLELHGA